MNARRSANREFPTPVERHQSLQIGLRKIPNEWLVWTVDLICEAHPHAESNCCTQVLKQDPVFPQTLRTTPHACESHNWKQFSDPRSVLLLSTCRWDPRQCRKSRKPRHPHHHFSSRVAALHRSRILVGVSQSGRTPHNGYLNQTISRSSTIRDGKWMRGRTGCPRKKRFLTDIVMERGGCSHVMLQSHAPNAKRTRRTKDIPTE